MSRQNRLWELFHILRFGFRIIAIMFSIFLPGLFVAVQLFHLQLIPLNFLLTIVNSIKEIPISPSLEMFFVLMIFEILNELKICDVREIRKDEYVYEVNFQANKTSIDKSSILKKLKSQCVDRC